MKISPELKFIQLAANATTDFASRALYFASRHRIRYSNINHRKKDDARVAFYGLRTSLETSTSCVGTFCPETAIFPRFPSVHLSITQARQIINLLLLR